MDRWKLGNQMEQNVADLVCLHQVCFLLAYVTLLTSLSNLNHLLLIRFDYIDYVGSPAVMFTLATPSTDDFRS